MKGSTKNNKHSPPVIMIFIEFTIFLYIIDLNKVFKIGIPIISDKRSPVDLIIIVTLNNIKLNRFVLMYYRGWLIID
jgi:hypothetical protein